MNNVESLKKVIKHINTNTKYPALQLVKENPEVAAMISKLVKPREINQFDINNKASHQNLNQSQIQAISDSVKARIKDNENIFQLFPDIELAVQILISSILSPKDMVKTDIIYKVKDAILPAELILKLNLIIKSHLEGYYNITEELQPILRATLFDTGSYVKVILPESIVDEVINHNVHASVESMSELFINDKVTSLGILGNSGEPKKGTALERFSLMPSKVAYNGSLTMEGETDGASKVILEDLFEITDNYKLLKLPMVLGAHAKNRIKEILNPKISLEATKLTNTEFTGLLYKEAQGETEQFVVIPTPANAKRKSVGRPLLMKLPSESVIPVFVPGDKTKHVGYFVLVDIDGNPVSASSQNDNQGGLSGIAANQGQNQSLSSMLIQKAKRNLASTDSGDITLDQITKVYSNIVEKNLMDRLRNGVYGNNASIGDNEEIYRIMLARSLASKYTRLIFIPSELATYFAFKYFNNGVGKSYLDDVKVLTSLRAIMLFSKVMAMTKNSIAITHVNMTLDPNDPDPQKSIEMASHEIVKMRQQYFPLGINSPSDLVDWIQRAGFEFSFEGHPGLPQTKFDFETKNLQHTVPDNELDELLRKQTYMAFSLVPEMVDNGFNSEFATTVVSNNILLSKRVIQIQEPLTKQLSDYARKIISNDSFALNDLLDVLKSNLGLIEKTLSDEEKTAFSGDQNRFLTDLLERYIDNLLLDLPKPDTTSIETQISSFDQYVESLDKTMDAWINSDFMTSDLTGEVSGNIDAIKAVVRNYFIRKWQSDNGFMPELNDIVTADEDGKATLNIYEMNKNHMEGVMRSAVEFIKSLQAIKQAADADLENMGVETSVDDTNAEDDIGADDFGGDDFDMGGDDTEEGAPTDGEDTSEEEPAEEEAPVEDGKPDEASADKEDDKIDEETDKKVV